MAQRAKPSPLIYPDSIRPARALPDAQSILRMGLHLTETETSVIRMAMAIHTASRQPKLLWSGWRHIAVAIAIGSAHARKASGGRMDSPLYRQVMTPFLNKTGFTWLNKDDRTAAVRMLPRWDEIDAWRSSLPPARQGKLNNPREIEREFNEHRKKIGDPDAKARPTTRQRRQFPSLLDQFEALETQLLLAQERAERAERETEYFAAMAREIAAKAKLDDDAVSEIRARIRATHEVEEQAESEQD